MNIVKRKEILNFFPSVTKSKDYWFIIGNDVVDINATPDTDDIDTTNGYFVAPQEVKLLRSLKEGETADITISDRDYMYVVPYDTSKKDTYDDILEYINENDDVHYYHMIKGIFDLDSISPDITYIGTAFINSVDSNETGINDYFDRYII